MRTGKKKDIRLLSDNLESVLRNQQWGRQLHLFPLTRSWPKIAGKTIADHSMPAYFRRDVLWVYVHNSLWMQQMQMAKPELLEKINTFFQGNPQVDDLRWLIQPAALIDRNETHYIPQQGIVDSAAEQKFKAMAESIPDPVTREAFCTMWRSLTAKHDTEQK